MKSILAPCVLIAAATLWACSGGGDAETEGPAREARAFYNAKCATCHGPTGAGDGVLSASLNPKPRDYRDAAWQATVTDAYMKTVILEGGRAGDLSALMPASPELKDDPEKLEELIKLIRSFSK